MFDLDGDGVELIPLAQSTTRFDLDGEMVSPSALAGWVRMTDSWCTMQTATALSVDSIEFGAGITAAMVTVRPTADGASLVLTIGTNGDSITIKNALIDSYDRIESVTFADGTAWSSSDLIQRTSSSANETIWSSWEANILLCGPGNDVLIGRTGSDTYRFNIGDGQDVIVDNSNGYDGSSVDIIEFGAGITPGMVTVLPTADGASLVMTIGTNGNSITIKNALVDRYDRIESVKFADGTSWTSSDLIQRTSTAANETIWGSYDADILLCGPGNDTLIGAYGSDTYRFNLGDGQDVIEDNSYYYDSASVDRIELGVGITTDIVTVSSTANGASLVLTIGSNGDSITIKNGLTDTYDRIELVKFSDGTTWSYADLVQRSFANNSGNDTFYGSYDGETINGGAGNDTILAGSGNDTLIGSVGSDSLTGGSGADGDSLVGTQVDTIADFARGTDRIDISPVDAQGNAAGDQAFSFIGTSAFGGVEGQLRYQIVGSTTRVQGDSNGDGVADFEIVLNGSLTLSATDFLL